MRYSLIVTVTARQDTLEAFEYYENIQVGLGEQFLADLEDRYRAIVENPLAYSYTDKKYLLRDIILKRFPYLIIFRIKGSVISVLSIHNRYKMPKSL